MTEKFKTLISAIFVAALLVVSTSCNKADNEVDCNAIADKVIEITKTGLDSLDKDEREAAIALLPTIRSEHVQQCTDNKASYAGETQACILAATTKDGLEACQPTTSKTPAE